MPAIHVRDSESPVYTAFEQAEAGVQVVLKQKPVHIDRARMDKALAAERVAIPSGMSDEELDQFILDVAAVKK